MSAKPGCCSLLFSQFVCWLERKQIPLLPRSLAFLWWFATNLDIFPEHKIGKDNECSSTFANVIIALRFVLIIPLGEIRICTRYF
ncbi:hypothetical protein [Myxosarcina sp. GI1(2024)]